MLPQGSLRKEFPVNIGGSDVCFFCRKRVYVMERLSAEGKFFHRSCFKCDYCGTTLRLSSYAFDVEDGKMVSLSVFFVPVLTTPFTTSQVVLLNRKPFLSINFLAAKKMPAGSLSPAKRHVYKYFR